MGRSLTWYVVRTPQEHDKTKPICFDLEFEPEKDDIELREKLYRIVYPDRDVPQEPYCMLNYKELSKLWYTHKYDHKDMWCPKCRFYNSGLCGSDSVIAEHDVRHSYSNPIWWSEWNISKFHMGNSNTDFVRRFSKEHLYREIGQKDIEYSYRKLEELGDPIRVCDFEAKQETMRVLAFLVRYASMDDVQLIFQDEY
jgi:hypothetical protein